MTEPPSKSWTDRDEEIVATVLASQDLIRQGVTDVGENNERAQAEAHLWRRQAENVLEPLIVIGWRPPERNSDGTN
jgi:hypothetical protein